MLSLEKLLKNAAGNGLEKIVHRAQNMDDLAQKLRLGLDPELGEQIVAVNVREDGALVVICESSAWAARLRYENDRLVAIAQNNGMPVNQCHIKVGR